MDPQQRLLLQLAWEACEDAGLPPETLKGQAVGVFIGLSSADYAQTVLRHRDQVDMHTVTGLAASVSANRLSYFFDLTGPSLVVDTACSSGLVALYLAWEQLRQGQCDYALVGAANLLLSPLIQQGFAEAQALSPTARCQPFAATADGIVRGEGAGMLLLARTPPQQARVYARIRGAAIGQDGLTQGLSAPSPAGQRRVLQAAYAAADLPPRAVGYIEAHGTGTPLGDPIEARALADVVGKDRSQPCLLGSVKSNLGHLEAAAGLAGLIKTALSLYHGSLPPSLHSETPNPRIAFGRNGLALVQQMQPWPEDAPYAGVSAFGFGGTNAHVVLERADLASESAAALKPEATGSAPYPLLFALSAKSWDSLQRYQVRLLAALPLPLEALARQLARGRSQLPCRRAVVAADLPGLAAALSEGPQQPAAAQNGPRQRNKPELVFVFAGMGGSHTVTLARALLQELPHCQVRFTAVDQALEPHLGCSLSTLLQTHPPESDCWQDQAHLQALIFGLQLALVTHWERQGIRPRAVLGSSMGEITAACCAGLLSLPLAAALLVKRIRLLQTRMGTGSLAVVGAAAETLRTELAAMTPAPAVWVAAENGPRLSVVAGAEVALNQLLKQWERQGLFVRRIPGATAPSHTPLMQPLAAELTALSQEIMAQQEAPAKDVWPQFWSSVSTEALDPGSPLPPDYWWQNVREPVRLFPTLARLHSSGHWLVLECAPQTTLSPALDGLVIRPAADKQPERRLQMVSSGLEGDSSKQAHPARRALLESLASLFERGLAVDWSRIYPEHRVLSLPPYAWEQQPCWLAAASQQQAAAALTTTAQQSTASPAGPHNLHTELVQLPEPERLPRLVHYLQQELADALQQPPEQLDPTQALKHLGIGSLVGMELYNRIRKVLNVQLPLSDILQGPSLEALAQRLLLELFAAEPTPQPLPPDRNAPAAEAQPLSPAQTRFWFLEQLQPGFAQHIPVWLELTGPLDIQRLHSALAGLLERHALLRTLYRSDSQAHPQQWTLMPSDPQAALQWQVLSVSAPASEAPDWHQIVRTQARQPFDLRSRPPFRIGLWQAGPAHYHLLIDMHHILADGYSFALLYRDLCALYQGQTLPALSHHFTDFVTDSQQQRQTPQFQAELGWWQSELADVPLQLHLPTDVPRPAVLDETGARYDFSLPPELVQTLEASSRDWGVSQFSILMAALQVVVQRLSAQHDFVIGTPVLGRNDWRWQEVVGPFLNLLPIRSSLQADPTGQSVAELIAAVQQRLLDAFDHQSVAFEDLIEALNPPRDLAWTPLVQVVLALHAPVVLDPLQAPAGSAAAAPVTVRHRTLDLGISRFDLALSLHPESGGLQGTVEYRQPLFRAETIAALVQAWQNVLAGMLVSDQTPVQRLCLQSPPWQALMGGVEQPPHPVASASDQSLPARIQAWVRHSPNTPALRSASGESLSYGQLWHRAVALAVDLQQLWAESAADSPQEGPVAAREAEDLRVVAVQLPPGPDLVVAWLGCWLASAAYLALQPELPELRREQICSEIGVQALILSDSSAPAGPGGLRVLPGQPAAPRHAVLPPAAEQDPQEALAYLILTSGSSGPPRAVALGAKGLQQLVDWHAQRYALYPGMPCAQLANPGFDAAGWEIWPVLSAGGCLLFAPEPARRDPQALWHWLSEHRIEQAFISTPLLLHCFQDWQQPPATLRVLLTGGAALTQYPPATWSLSVHNHYGPTENTVVTTAACIEAQTERAAATLPELGQPLPGQSLYLLDACGQPLPAAFAGELAISGPQLAWGYWRAPEQSAGAFVNTPAGRIYRSGDRVRLQAGQLQFLGRLDRQLKLRGMRLEPGEIEAQLCQHPAVKAAHVALHNQQLLAWVLTPDWVSEAEGQYQSGRAPAAGAELRDWLARYLPPALLPTRILPLARLPLTDRGKLDVSRLPAIHTGLKAEPDHSAEQSADASERAHRLARIWQALLGVYPAAESRFFASGGHSLLALDLRHQVQQTFGVALPLQQLFQNDRFSSLLQWLETAPPEPEPLPALQPAPARWAQPFPLTPVQQAYWIGRHQALHLGGVAAHAYLEIRYTDLDPRRLEAALQALITRHPMLRMQVTPDGQQRVLAEPPLWQLPLHDWRDCTAEDWQSLLTDKRQALQEEVRDPLQWPLFDVQLLLLPTEQRLCLSLDALMADASSLQILAHDLEQLYAQEHPQLPPSELHFQDWVHYLASLEQHPRYQRDRDWWLERLPQLPPPPKLPQRQTGAAQTGATRMQRLAGHLEAHDWQTLQDLAHSRQVTPTALLLSAFVSALSGWQERAPMTLNLTTFQRLPVHPEINRLVGDFTRLSLVAAHPELDFWAQTQSLQTELLQVLEHGLFTGVELMRILRQRAAQEGPLPAGESGLFPVVFTSALGQGDLKLPLGGKSVYARTQTPQVWLDHQLMTVDGQLHYHWDYPEARFEPQLMPAIFAAWEAQLQHLLHQAKASAPDLNWQALHWPPAAASPPRNPANPYNCLHLAAVQQALQTPDATAVIAPDRQLSYAQLFQAALKLAAEMAPHLPAQPQAGQPPAVIALLLEPGWPQAVGVIATLLAGAAYLPLSLDWPAARLDAVLQQAAPAAVLCDDLQRPALQALAQVYPCLELTPRFLADWEAAPNPPEPDKAWRQELAQVLKRAQQEPPPTLAYIIFTSGSSGQPKGVMVAHPAAWNTVRAVNAELQLQAEDRILALSDLSFDLSVYDLFGALSAGAALVYPRPEARREPSHWLALCQQHSVSIWNSVPALLEMLSLHCASTGEGHAAALLQLRAVLLSGDWIPLHLPAAIWQQLNPDAQIYSLGGATEGAIWSIWHPITAVSPDWPSIPYGKAMPAQAVYVLDPWLSQTPNGVRGEIYLAGTGVAEGYLGQPELSQARFFRHPISGERLYRTGDDGYYDDTGTLWLLGRRDQQVKLGGHRVELGEIEAQAQRHPEVQQAVALAVALKPAAATDPHPPRSLALCWQGRVDRETLQAHLAAHLPPYMLPVIWQPCNSWPLTATGKIDRQALSQTITSGRWSALPAAPASSPETSPASNAQLQSWVADLRAVMRQTLDFSEAEMAQVEPETDLLSLGIHSMDMVRLGHALETRFGQAPGVGDLLRLRNLKALAGFYLSAQRDSAPLVQEQPSGNREKPPHIYELAPDSAPLSLAQGLSQRDFGPALPSPRQLGSLLSVLSHVAQADAPAETPTYRARYASASALYAVRVYVHLRQTLAPDLSAGLWQYLPREHRLALLAAGTHWPYPGVLQQDWTGQAQLAFYLCADLEPLRRQYGSDARDYALLEAGSMAQLLRQQAPHTGLGLCGLGQVDVQALAALFALPERPLFSLLGGSLAETAAEQEWEEWII